MAKSIVIYLPAEAFLSTEALAKVEAQAGKETGRSSVMSRLAEVYHFSPITLLSGKYLQTANAATGFGKVKKMARLRNRVTI